jgi:hypothetical protein
MIPVMLLQKRDLFLQQHQTMQHPAAKDFFMLFLYLPNTKSKQFFHVIKPGYVNSNNIPRI